MFWDDVVGSVEADDDRQIAGADDWQLQRLLARSSSTDTAAPCPGDIGWPSEQAYKYTRPAPWRPASMSQANQSRMKLRDCLRSFYTHMVKFLRIKVLKYLAGFSDLQLGIYDSEFQTSKGAWTLKAFAESASAIRDTYSRLNNVSDDRTVDVTEQSLSLSLKVRSLSLSLSLRASPCSSPVLLIYQYNSKL